MWTFHNTKPTFISIIVCCPNEQSILPNDGAVMCTQMQIDEVINLNVSALRSKLHANRELYLSLCALVTKSQLFCLHSVTCDSRIHRSSCVCISQQKTCVIRHRFGFNDMGKTQAVFRFFDCNLKLT